MKINSICTNNRYDKTLSIVFYDYPKGDFPRNVPREIQVRSEALIYRLYSYLPSNQAHEKRKRRTNLAAFSRADRSNDATRISKTNLNP